MNAEINSKVANRLIENVLVVRRGIVRVRNKNGYMGQIESIFRDSIMCGFYIPGM